MRRPTGDECDKNSVIFETENQIGYAIWYPQMGGYSGTAVAVMSKSGTVMGSISIDTCVDVYVWHDGEFPFEGESPKELHHCDPMQFVHFGNKLASLQEKHITVEKDVKKSFWSPFPEDEDE